MAFLTDNDRQTLRQICDTFVPKNVDAEGANSLAEFSAHDVHVLQQTEETIERIGGEGGQKKLRRSLALIRSSLMNGFMAGIWDRFSELSLDERTKVLNAWASGHLGAARKSFQAVGVVQGLFESIGGRRELRSEEPVCRRWQCFAVLMRRQSDDHHHGHLTLSCSTIQGTAYLSESMAWPRELQHRV